MFSLNYDTMRLVDELGEYVSALREAGYAISLCKLDSVFYAVFPPSADYLRHDFEYCAIVKKTRNEKCLERQNLLLENLSEGDCEFSACHAGVCEYVSPIVEGGEKYGIVCLSGYRKEGESGRGVAYERLCGEVPTEKRARALINPVLRILSEIVRAEKEASQNAGKPEKTVREVMRFVAENLDVPFTADDVCAAVFYSQSYVRREFKRITGESLFGYIERVRVEKAQKLLTDTDKTVKEIACAVGFPDQNYFSVAFKRVVGVTPSDYRKAYKG